MKRLAAICLVLAISGTAQAQSAEDAAKRKSMLEQLQRVTGSARSTTATTRPSASAEQRSSAPRTAPLNAEPAKPTLTEPVETRKSATTKPTSADRKRDRKEKADANAKAKEQAKADKKAKAEASRKAKQTAAAEKPKKKKQQ